MFNLSPVREWPPEIGYFSSPRVTPSDQSTDYLSCSKRRWARDYGGKSNTRWPTVSLLHNCLFNPLIILKLFRIPKMVYVRIIYF